MKAIIRIIIKRLERLTNDERSQAAVVMSRHFGRTLEWTEQDLMTLSKDQLTTISQVLSGMILTKEYVPDVREMHEMLKDKNLPSEIPFGRREDSELS